MTQHTVYVIYKDGEPCKWGRSNKNRRSAYASEGTAKAVITDEVKGLAYDEVRRRKLAPSDPNYDAVKQAIMQAARRRYKVVPYGPIDGTP